MLGSVLEVRQGLSLSFVCLCLAMLAECRTADAVGPTANNRTNSMAVLSQRYGSSLSYSDPDGGTMTFTLLSGPSQGTLEYYSSGYQPVPAGTPISLSYWYYSTTATVPGTDSFTWQVSDGTATSAPGTVSITLSANTVPTVNNQSMEMLAGSVRKSLSLSYSHSDGYQPKTFLMSGPPAHGSVEYLSGTSYVAMPTNTGVSVNTWYYTPAVAYAGPDSVQWRMCDGIATSSVATYSLSVTTNRMPVATNSVGVCMKNSSLTMPARYGDPDSGQTKTLRVVGGAAHGGVTISGSSFIYTPASGYEGADSFAWVVNDSVVDSNVATNRVLVRAENSRGGMTVLLVVKDTLLPEITNEVARWQADLITEGYTAKIKSWSSTDAAQLWSYLVSEYETAGQFVCGATLIGNLPTATGMSSGETTDYAFMNMLTFRDNGPNKQHIWVSRIWTVGFAGGEVKRAKWAMDANHGYRAGTHRLPYGAYWYDSAYGAVNAGNAVNTLIVWPTIEQLYPMDAFRKGGEFENSEIHSDGAFSGFDCHPSQLRYSTHSSCGPGRLGGPVNQNSCTYGGGVIMSMGSTATAYSGQNVVMNHVTYFNALAAGDTFGNGMVRPGLNPYGDYERDMFYGDLSLPAKAAPSNQIPVISSLTADKTSGSAPLTVNFAVAASDPDGVVSNYEWFVNGFNGGYYAGPVYAGTATNCTHTFTTAHRYPAEVQAVDNYMARAWTSKEIAVNPTPGQPVRVRCGKNFGYYAAGWDYTDGSGNVWLHDQAFAGGTWGYSGGTEGYVAQAVADTDDDILYQYFRSTSSDTGSSFTYRVPVANGGYWLRLKLADMQSTAAGQRVMDVVAEGATQVYGLDVFAQVGGKKALTVPLYVEVADGELTFTVSKNASSPNEVFLNCFEVVPYSMGNRPPQAQSQTITTTRNISKAVTLTAMDPDGDSFTYAIVAQPAHGTLSGTAPNIVYSPAADYVGPDQFTFKANDGTCDGTIGGVSITVGGLIAQWKFDETEGTNAVDATGSGNTGTLQGGPVWNSSGKLAGALDFDGTNDYVSTTLQSQGPTIFTLALWFKTTTTSGGKLIGFGGSQTGQSGSYDRHIYMDNAGKIYFGVYPGSVQTINSTAALNDGNWHHVAATLSGEGMKLYVDGVPVASNAGVTSAQVYSGWWKIGYDNVGGWNSVPSSFYFKGLLDDVRIYNYAMSAGDVADMMVAEGLPVKPAISGFLAVTGMVGEAFSYTIVAGGTPPIGIGVSGLPAGLSFDGNDRIGGTPQAAGTNNVTLTAANAYGGATNTLVLTILPENHAPTVATAASASPNTVTGTTSALSVLGADDGGETNLTYNWTALGAPPAPVTFSANGNNGAKNVTAIFAKAGSYSLRATIRDSGWGKLAVTSTVSVTVNQTLTAIVVSPASVSALSDSTQTFTATANDQFGYAMPSQPGFAWTVTGGGTIDAGSGLFTAGGTAGGPYTVTATGGGKSGTASVTVVEVVPGLAYEYYQGSWSSGGYLPDFSGLAPVSTGVVSTFSLAPRLRDTDFAFRYRGKIAIATGGSYTFYTSSDDGSQLYIDGCLIVNNDGPHGIVEQSGATNLAAGFHDIVATFCQGGGGWGLTVIWAGPGIGKAEIPSNVLFRAAANSNVDAYGIPNSWKIQYFGGTNAPGSGAMDDPDHDGMSNLAECRAGTNPTNGLSLFKVTECEMAGNSNFVITWLSVAGKYYTIRGTTNLLLGFPILVTNHVAGTPPANSCTVTVEQAAQRFYRVLVEP